jgi:hypothetical protein
VIAWSVGAGPCGNSVVHVQCVCRQEGDFRHSTIFELEVELLFSKGGCFAVYESFARVREVGRDGVVVHG